MNLRRLGAAVLSLVCACGGAPSAPKTSAPDQPARAATKVSPDAAPAREGSLREAFERARKGPPAYGKEKQEQRELDEITAMLDLRPRALGDRPMLRTIDEELLRRSRRFMQSHMFESMRLRDPRAPAVERRYGAWIADNLLGWDPDLQATAVTALFPPRTVGASSVEPWPGVDRSALAWTLIDAYRSAPPTTRDGDEAFLAATFLLCTRGELGARTRRSARCADEFTQYALSSQERQSELARALTLRDDPSITASVMRSVQVVESRDDGVMLQLIAALEPAKNAWLAAMRVLAESEHSFPQGEKGQREQAELLREAQRVWAQRPSDVERRGAVLYVLASRRGIVDWSSFASKFGAAIQPEELAAFLAVNPARAMQRAHLMVPAFAARVSPADAFARASLPALQRFLEASKEDHALRGGEYETMNDLVGAICMSRRQADARTIGAALADYEKAQRRKMFGTLADAWRERHCLAPTAKGPKDDEVRRPEPPVAPQNKVQLVPTGAAKGTQRVDLKPSP